MSEIMRSVLCAVVFIAVLSSPLAADDSCGPACGSFIGKTATPFAEYIWNDANNPIQIPGDGVWRDVGAVCMLDNSVPNIRSTQPFNIAMRGFLEFVTTNVAVGARYETQLVLRDSDGQEHSGGWHAKAVRGIQSGGIVQPPNDANNQPQGDWFHGAVMNNNLCVPVKDVLPRRCSDPLEYNYTFSLKVRLLGGGTMTLKEVYLHAMGAPVTYGGATYASCPTQYVGGSWTNVAQVTINNTSGQPANYSLQGYAEIIGGQAGDVLYVGFGIDNQSSGSHYANIYVPAELPSGIHVRDVIPNEAYLSVPTGSHTLKMWMKNPSGRFTSINCAELQAVGFKEVLNASYATASDTKTVTSMHQLETQPDACFLRDKYVPGVAPCTYDQLPNCGFWTLLATMTPTGRETNLLPMIDAYVELLGHQGAPWQNSRGQIAIEVVALDRSWAFEAGMMTFDIPAGPRHISIQGDATLIALDGARINLWIRKMTCISNEDVSFTVGKRYIGIRSANIANYCYSH